VYRTLSTCLLGVVLILLVACQSPPPENRGRDRGRIDPSQDSKAERNARSPRSADLVAATDKMAQDIASRLDITNSASPPRIVVGRIENHSVMSDQNYQVFLVRLRSLLQSSGAREGLVFVRERAFMEGERDREFGTRGDSSGAAYESSADYMLTCEVLDLPTGGTNYYLFSYQLVQMRAAETGPDVVPGAIVWENMYEVQYQ